MKHIIRLFIVVFAVTILAGCSREASYQVLSFFFDGVPDFTAKDIATLPDSMPQPNTQLLASLNTKTSGPAYILHPPYTKRECSQCHDKDADRSLNQPQTKVCYKCHVDFTTKYTHLHGPVGGGYCTACHAPHMSERTSLLTRSGNALCTHCHDISDIAASSAHQSIEQTACTSCHNPHGGSTRFVLK